VSTAEVSGVRFTSDENQTISTLQDRLSRKPNWAERKPGICHRTHYGRLTGELKPADTLSRQRVGYQCEFFSVHLAPATAMPVGVPDQIDWTVQEVLPREHSNFFLRCIDFDHRLRREKISHHVILGSDYCIAVAPRTGRVQLVNHLGVNLGHDPEMILARLDQDDFAERDIEYNSGRVASDRGYAEHVREFTRETPARFNADSRCLYEASGSAGKIMIFAVRVDTFPKEEQTKVFYIGTNDPAEFTGIRQHMLAHFKDLPISAEYMHRGAFDIAERYGKDIFLTIQYLGTEWLPRLFAAKGWFDGMTGRLGFVPPNLSDKMMYWISRIFPSHLPAKLKEYRDKYEHYLMLKMSGDGILSARRFLAALYPSERGDFFECTDKEGEKVFLHRFAAAGAGVRFRALHRREVDNIVALDVALRRNDLDWFETLPDDLESVTLHKLYYGHFFCHVFHQDYIVRKGHDSLQLSHVPRSATSKQTASSIAISRPVLAIRMV